MAGSIIVNGKEVWTPGTYFEPEYLKLQSRPPLSADLALVGEFPFLPKAVPYVSLTQADFDRLSPASALRKRLSNIVWDASDDPAVQNSPRSVILVSATTTGQATGTLYDVNDDPSVTLKASQWGLEGNQTHFAIVENTVRGGWDVTIRNGSYIEPFYIPPEPPLMRLEYNPDPGVSPFDVSYSPSLSVENGTVAVTFTQALDEADAGAVPGDTSWSSLGPVDGDISILPAPGGTIGTGKTLVVKVTGVSKTTGLTTTVTTNFIEADIEAVTPVAKTNGPWAGPVTMVIEEADSLTWVGDLTITGNVVAPMNAASGFPYVSDVISRLSLLSVYGFAVTSLSTRVASAKLADLDDLAADPLPAELTSTLWKIVTEINRRSRLVTAERVGDLPPDVDTTPTAFFLIGGTETSAGANDWRLALEALEFINVDVLVPFYDPTGVDPQDDTVLPLFLDHLNLMWANGQNERVAWFPVGDDETLDELRARIVRHGSDLVSMPIDRISMVQYNNQVESLAPYWTAVLMGAMDASTSGLVNFTWRSPRITGYQRHEDLYTRDARDELMKMGALFFVQDAGMAVPQVARDYTSYTVDNDPRRYSRTGKRSLMLSQKNMRSRAIRPLLTLSNGRIATRADFDGAMRAELVRQRDTGIIKNFDPSKVIAREYDDRFEGEYEATVQIGKDFVIIRPKISASNTQAL